MKFSEKITQTRQLIDEHKTIDAVRLIGVTKYLDFQGTEDAILSGLHDIGENRLQIAETKILKLKPKYPHIKWHFLGRVQTNKAKKIVQLFDYIHSIESFEKLLLIDKICMELNSSTNILIQLDIAKEETKQGMTKEAFLNGLAVIKNLKKARFCGLMTMAPLTDDESILRPIFKDIKTISLEAQRAGINCKELSMGMSNDYLIALQEGATMLRLGTTLFLQGGKNE